MLSGRLKARAGLSWEAALSWEVDWCAVVTGALKDLVAGREAVTIRQMARIMLHAAVGPPMQLLAQPTRAKTWAARGRVLPKF